MLSGLAIAGIICFVVGVLVLMFLAYKYFYTKTDNAVSSSMVAESQVRTSMTMPSPAFLMAPPPMQMPPMEVLPPTVMPPSAVTVVAPPPVVRPLPPPPPALPPPPPAVPPPPPAVPPPPPALPPSAPPATTLTFVDRGCWKDGGFVYGSPNADPEDPFNRALGLDNVMLLDSAMLPEQYYAYGVEQATAGRFDTFAFTQGFEGVELRMGNYGSLDVHGNMNKYDKFGRDESGGVCDQTLSGDIYVNRVYSLVAPYSVPVGFKRYIPSDFVDRGCYLDGDPYTGQINKGYGTIAGPIAGACIVLDSTGQPRENWFNYAMFLAVENYYDTIGFQTDSATQEVYLYLGYYRGKFRYDRFGKMPETVRAQVGCLEFGNMTYLRVYSAIAPAASATPAASMFASASSWLRRK